MKKRIKNYLLITTLLLVSNTILYSQAQSVQSFLGETDGDYFGHNVSNAGDVNNDGIDDIIVGAPFYGSYKGRAYIYYGGSPMNSGADVILIGENDWDYFGWSVSAAGDVNNDGIADIIVGANGYNSSTGRAYIYYGGDGAIDNTVDVTMNGETSSDNFGNSVSFAGDVNNDGYDDVIIGANKAVSDFNGRAYIYYGGDGAIDNTVDVTLTNISSGEYFGGTVSNAGDVNGDGYDDVIVGAERYNTTSWYGRAYIFLGGNGSMNTVVDLTITGTSQSHLGYPVSAAGDVNNDGFDDVIVGANGYNSNVGRAYIYYGGNSLNSVADVTFNGEVAGDHFGVAVSNAGDINGDAYDDVIVGASEYNSEAGRVYIYYGGNGSMNSVADLTIDGENGGDYFGYSVSYAADPNNDNFDDVIIGAYGHNSNTGKSYIYSDPLAPLPVELTSFTATVIDGGVMLNWATATEINNYGFEIEASVNGSWNVVAFVNGHGNSNSSNEYTYFDNSGATSYRLKQIDNNGGFEYSDVITVSGSLAKTELYQNHPNPFNPSTQISFSLANAGNVNISVYNALGQKVAELVNGNMNAGTHNVEFNTSSRLAIASGLYFYKLETANYSKTMKMLLVK